MVTDHHDADVIALLTLAKHNIRTDIQELLIAGDPMRDIVHGAISKVLEAERKRLSAELEPVIRLAEDRGKFWRSHQRAAKDREDKTRFAVKAEQYETAAFRARNALAGRFKP
ncbi:MAG: hypothetical protein ACTHJQ_01530 [Rhizobiaceae bacterium]